MITYKYDFTLIHIRYEIKLKNHTLFQLKLIQTFIVE